MEFCVLGTLGLRDGDRVTPLGGPMQRALLAHLILAGQRPVAAADLVARLWQGGSLTRAYNTLQVHVLRLRRALGSAGCAARIVSLPGAYQLDLYGDTLDADRFESVIAEAARATDSGDPRRGCTLLEGVPSRWWRPLLEGLAGDWPRYPEARRLAELRIEAAQLLAVARLATARPDAAAKVLRELAAEYPGRERLRYLLALSLYRADRRAEALEVYEAAYRYAAGELGLEPSADLQRLQRAILCGDAVPASARQANG